MNTRLMMATAGAMGLMALLVAQDRAHGAPPAEKDLAQQIFDTMLKASGDKAGFRPVHAKGIVCTGTFAPAKEAATLSKAAHFKGPSVPVTVRFSDGSSDPMIPDSSPHAGPRGMAIRFTLPGGDETDIVAMSHNGFVVSNGDEFLELQKAIVATDPSKPHPWAIEEFLGKHPLAMKFVKDNEMIPTSFATESFFSNDAFLFETKDGTKQAARYKIIPLAGQHNLSEADAKTKSPNFLGDELKAHLAKEPIKYRLIAQIPNAGDRTNDPSLVWPDDRNTIELGIISVAAIDPNSAATEKELAFDPTNFTDGIELSDDVLPALRSSVYALSVAHRQQK